MQNTFSLGATRMDSVTHPESTVAAPLESEREPPIVSLEGDETPMELAESSAEPAGASERMDRKRLEEQLLALKRKELELRRALAIADHPELAEAIRLLDGRAYALTRVEAKIAQGLSKAEDRRKETLEKKLAGLREKRAELDRQIAEVEAEHVRLVHEREQALESERRAALQDLVLTLGQHSSALAAAGLEVAELVPEIGQRLPEIRALAEELTAARSTPVAAREIVASA